MVASLPKTASQNRTGSCASMAAFRSRSGHAQRYTLRPIVLLAIKAQGVEVLVKMKCESTVKNFSGP